MKAIQCIVCSKKCTPMIKSSYVFMILNVARDERFDLIPSHTLEKHSQL